MRIRFRPSLQRDTGSPVRNNVIAPPLRIAGFVQRGKTGMWEAEGMSWQVAALALSQVLQGLAEAGPGCIDHLWLYVETEAGASDSQGSGSDAADDDE